MEGIVIGLSIHHQRGCVRMKDQPVHPLWVHLNVQHRRCRVLPQHLDGRRTCRRFDEIGVGGCGALGLRVGGGGGHRSVGSMRQIDLGEYLLLTSLSMALPGIAELHGDTPCSGVFFETTD